MSELSVPNHIQSQTSVRRMSGKEAAQFVFPGARVMVGGFGMAGTPEHVLKALTECDTARDLTVISNNITQGSELSTLFRMGRIRKAIGSYFTSNKSVVQGYRAGQIDIELMPQGTLAEALRLGGAGIPAFYTPTGAGTLLAEGHETRQIDGVDCLLVKSLTADIALVRAHRADTMGNLVYRKTARNFNPLMATAARLTIVEVDEVVPVGTLDPETIVTPFIFTDILVEREVTDNA